MNDLEARLTDHLARRAARAEPRHDLDGVRREAVRSSDGSSSRRRRLPRGVWTGAGAIAAAAAIVVAVAALGLGPDGPSVETEDQDRADPETVSGTRDLGPVRLDLRRPLPEEGFAVRSDTGELVLYDHDGNVVARGGGPVPYLSSANRIVAREDGNSVVITTQPVARYAGESGNECAELDRTPSGSIEACPTAPGDRSIGRLVHVLPDGTRRDLVGKHDLFPWMPVGEPGGGHWSSARLSPDGEWLAAQWSGDCETPTAYLVRIADGTVLESDGAPLHTDPEDEASDEATVVGWEGDSAVIATVNSPCGPARRSAVVGVNPDTGAVREILPLATDADGFATEEVQPWSRSPEPATPQSIRDVDFATFTYDNPCPPTGQQVTLVGGTGSTEPPAPDSKGYSISLLPVEYVDIQGDGQEEAVVATFCFVQMNEIAAAWVGVYGIGQTGEPELIGTPLANTDNVVDRPVVDGTRITIETYTDPDFLDTVTTVWEFDGERFHPVQ